MIASSGRRTAAWVRVAARRHQGWAGQTGSTKIAVALSLKHLRSAAGACENGGAQ